MYETIQNLNSIRFNSTHLNPTELNLHDVGHGRELNKNPIFMAVNRVCLEFRIESGFSPGYKLQSLGRTQKESIESIPLTSLSL